MVLRDFTSVLVDLGFSSSGERLLTTHPGGGRTHFGGLRTRGVRNPPTRRASRRRRSTCRSPRAWERLATPDNAAVLGALRTGNPSGISLDDSSFIGRLDPQLAAPFKTGFSGAITHIMVIAAFITVIAFVLSFLVPEIPAVGESPATRGRKPPA